MSTLCAVTTPKVLNPSAMIFYSRFKVYNSFACNHPSNVLNPYAKVFKLSCTPPKMFLNPCVKSFVPQYILLNANYVIIAILVTLLVLFILILMQLKLLINQDVDGMSPKELIKKMKNDYPNKIMIGHLNINSIRHKLSFLFLRLNLTTVFHHANS